MAHLAGGAVADYGYQFHHFAKSFGRFPWELEAAVESGEVNVRQVFHAMAIEAADSKGREKRRKADERKARMKQRASRGA